MSAPVNELTLAYRIKLKRCHRAYSKNKTSFAEGLSAYILFNTINIFSGENSGWSKLVYQKYYFYFIA